jgi:MerR family transcriptional regulator, thiopeptide resistance regulator
MQTWKIGELARATGLTVRTLHHYDTLGLLRPARRSARGYRLYGTEDLERLQRIVSLRQLGFPLEEIRECLEGAEFSMGRVLEMHLERARQRLVEAEGLVRRLEAVMDQLRHTGSASPEALIRTIEAITMYEKYYTPEQLEALRQRAEAIGPERIREVESEWPRLIAEVRAEMERGTDPADPRVQALARRWTELVAEFTGGDPGIERSVSNLYRGEPEMRDRAGLDPGLFEYVSRASASEGGS